MKITTVRGEIQPDELGVTMAHEHFLIDVTCRHRPPTDPYLSQIAQAPVSIEILGDLRRNP